MLFPDLSKHHMHVYCLKHLLFFKLCQSVAELLFLKLYLLFYRISVWSRKKQRYLWTNLSIILLIFEVRDNGQYLVRSQGSAFLEIGITLTGLPLKKTQQVWLPHTKTMFYCYDVQFQTACHSVICVKLNIGKKITGLEILALNHKKSSMFPNL